MKRVLQQTVLFLALLALLIVIRFPYSEYAHKRILGLRQTLAPYGVQLKIGKTALQFPGTVRVERIDLVIPARGTRVPLLIDSITMRSSLLWLLLLRVQCRGEAVMYGGTVNAELGVPLFGSTVELDLHAGGLDAGRHPLIRGLGAGGTLNVSLDAKLARAGSGYAVSEAKLTLNMIKAQYAGGHKIGGLFALPAVRDAQLEVVAEETGPEIRFRQLQLTSSLGKLRAQGALVLDDRFQARKIDLGGTIDLTAAGVNAVGGYLALAAQLPVDQPPTAWKFQLQQGERDRAPAFRVQPL